MAPPLQHGPNMGYNGKNTLKTLKRGHYVGLNHMEESSEEY